MASNSEAQRGAATAQIQLLATGTPIWATPLNGTVNGLVYSATDVRFVLGQADILELTAVNSNWELRVSGYELSA